jgi:hypothetical protein
MKEGGGTIMTIMEMPERARSATRLPGEYLVAQFSEAAVCNHRTSRSRVQIGLLTQNRRESRLEPSREGQRRIERNTSLQSLAGDSLASRYHAWRGGSGRRYICSVFAIAADVPEANLPDYTDVVVLAVAGDENGARRCLSVFMRGTTADLVAQRRFVVAALEAGAVEWHIHLLAADGQQRRIVADDIIAGHMLEASKIR